ncbi:MAG: insulinase family protein [Spirochaetaceae bacterium]|jgi:Zn-dependent M16 (insulinase) family peptidase|nr:insulinase family protein [Spirochaetaceae bacterium]
MSGKNTPAADGGERPVYRPGDKLPGGFRVIETVDLAEFDAAGMWAKHEKSGAEVFHILNDDTENLFAFVFATTPEDSTGVPHILEHTVLCGSERYPLKDAFLVLAQGSLQTFLNAWTFPDKTLYPASSVNERDYFNLMSVYGDAVFRPLLSEWSFMQEGHRLVLDRAAVVANDVGGEGHDEAARITGVVYNEMKGAYSSPDAYAALWSIKSVLGETPYGFESGGDPEAIPGLTWEGLRAFHRSRYAPANCRIFLAGNIPTEKQLAFLDDQFLSRLPGGEAVPPSVPARRWESPRVIRAACPAGADTKATVFMSWLCSDSRDSGETLALSTLTHILFGHDGSPLTRALIESGLGEDLSPVTGLETELRETVFTAGLRGVSMEKSPGGITAEAKIESLIMGELEKYVRDGLPPGEIEAALLALEFASREIRRAGGPWSLTWLRRAFRGWLYGAKPWEGVVFAPVFEALKEKLARDSRYFESLIKKYFLDNNHRAMVILEPETDFLAKKDAALAASLAEKTAALSAAERREIHEKAAELERFQSAGEDPEALKTIPHLTRGDLSREIELVPREVCDIDGVPALIHGLYTNGITYADLAFPVDTLDAADYKWLPLFTGAVVSMGLPGMDYAEVSSRLARAAGGFFANLHSGVMLPGMGNAFALPQGIFDLGGRDWIMFHLKALDEKWDESLALARALIAEADFSDTRRLRDLVLEMKNENDAALAPDGSSYASLRAGRGLSRSRAVENTWHGLEQLSFAHTLTGYDIAEISGILTGIRDRIRAAGCIVNLTAAPGSLPEAISRTGKAFAPFGAPRPRKPGAGEDAGFSPEPGGVEVFASPSLQIGFAARAVPAASYVTPDHAAELLLSHELSTGALWEDIRMKGGAYGASAFPDGLEKIFVCSTYRDPSPLRSLDSFPAILKKRSAGSVPEEMLEKTIIGSYARGKRPHTPADKGHADFVRFLTGFEDAHRARHLSALIDAQNGDLTRAAARLSRAAGNSVIIAGNAAAKEAAREFGVEIQPLPV